MKKMTEIAGCISAAFLIVGCQNSEDGSEDLNDESVDESSADEYNLDENEELENNGEENGSNENKGEESLTEADENGNKENEEDAIDETDENDSDAYAGTQETPDYLIGSQYIEAEVDGIVQFYTAFSIKRDGDEQLSHEESIEMSLNDGDLSEQDILSSYADISVEWPKLHIHFNEDGNELSATSAQSGLFYDSLLGISDLYGIEEVLFFNPEGENDIIVAERGIDEPLIVQNERGLTRGYYTIYDEDLEETLFLAGGELDEQVEDESGEPLSFPETVEAMHSIDREDAFYSSAIVEGMEIVNSSMENGIATVQYTAEEEVVTEADLIVFENAMQLAALDFHAWEVRLINDTTKELITYPLVGQ
ncbi:hypothetical protein [Salipaludibacillus aurantiacus]|uniref:Sporulation and spore germination n=1 Tax=Salipaludibacillus aurantiacus TaxID=1601833 RepID=A0A1H9X5S8_9BACI|nr:hypothetical protein [Salipaludibacillus aurantiacus]SES41217.1 hypothetical protein SAMN05518684_1258 [Salipaludibacillus aurantiacus]